MATTQVQEQQKRKWYPCRRGCGTEITFDARYKVSDGSKFIPLVENALGQLSPHQCTNYNPKSTTTQTPPTSTVTPPPPPVTLDSGPQLAILTEEVAELRSEVRDLVAAVQFLRMELKQKK